MIEGITSLDVYSHLRVEVTARSGEYGRTRREKNVTGSSGDFGTATGRRANRDDLLEEDAIVAFEQSALPEDQGYAAATAEEVRPALEASVLPVDPQMEQVARLYRRTGRNRSGRTAAVGSRLAVYA